MKPNIFLQKKNKENPSFNVKKFKRTNLFHCFPWELHGTKPYADHHVTSNRSPYNHLFLKVPHLHRCQHHVTYTSHASSKWPEMTVIRILQGLTMDKVVFQNCEGPTLRNRVTSRICVGVNSDVLFTLLNVSSGDCLKSSSESR